MIRYSRLKDERDIKKLLESRFYPINSVRRNSLIEGEIPSMKDRFLLYEDPTTGGLLGCLGIIPPTYSKYYGYTLDWGCVKEGYDGQKIMTKLVQKFLDDLPPISTVWAECWRTLNNPWEAHIHKVLTNCGFTLAVKSLKHWPVRGGCVRAQNKTCKFASHLYSCQCWEDLYTYYKDSAESKPYGVDCYRLEEGGPC